MKEDKNFRNRNNFVLIFEVLLIFVAIIGLTYATSKLMNGTSTIINFGKYNVYYNGQTEIETTNLEPISDKLINKDIKEGVIRLEFSLKGVETNDSDELIYDIMISNIDIDCSLLNEYTKWNLYKNGELLYHGNFSPTFDKNILSNNYRLTETQQDLPRYDQEYDNYILIVWISETCEDLTNCTLIDQTQTTNSKINMKIFVAISGGEKVEYIRETSNNLTCINKPELYDGMIPVYYEEGNWKIADTTNSDDIWYDYSNSKWANAVFVDTDKYNDKTLGDIINQEDIIAYYVWIPRYKYKVWNIEEKITDSYDAYSKGIDIIYESGVHSTGNIKCIDTKCLGKNNDYLTHPAFSNDLRGFWVSKYEISDGNKFIPNTNSLINLSLDEFKNNINNLSDIYGISNNADSHIITNLEWGAISYLSHSKYGLCKENICKNMEANQSYISETQKLDTTTRNVYGVYDMAGGASEYAIGNIALGSATSETALSENETWYKGSYIINNKDYIVRGGINSSLFSTNDIGMYDISTRSVLTSK